MEKGLKMDGGFVQKIMYDCLMITLLVSAPILLGSMLVGLIISILQAATSIQEQTLTFVPKMVAIFLSLIFFGPWIIELLMNYSQDLFQLMGMVGQQGFAY